MWHKKINVQNVGSAFLAFSLVEVLISLSLGTIILLSAIKFYSDYIIDKDKYRELFNLQKHSHQILDYLQHHIQHIGYQGKHRKDHNWDLFVYNRAYSLNNPQCFIFIYDLNSDGCIGLRNKNLACNLNNINNTKDISKEIFGIKFENNIIYVLDDSKNIQRCYKNECLQILKECNKFKWSKMSELSEYNVEKLNFSWLKEGVLLKIELVLSSVKAKEIQYSAIAYSYIFNARD